MAVLNATQNTQHTNTSAEQIQTDTANLIIGVVLLGSALIGCSLTLLALGKDFFVGKNPPSVLVSALVWVDFIGALSTAVLVFHGFVQGPEWMMYSPQCTLQVCQEYWECAYKMLNDNKIIISSYLSSQLDWLRTSTLSLNGEFKLHVYGKRQTSDSNWEFLKIENEQIKAAQNNSQFNILG